MSIKKRKKNVKKLLFRNTYLIPKSPKSFVDAIGMLDNDVKVLSFTIIVISNVALKSGSSQQGNERRASVASNCVVAFIYPKNQKMQCVYICNVK